MKKPKDFHKPTALYITDYLLNLCLKEGNKTTPIGAWVQGGIISAFKLKKDYLKYSGGHVWSCFGDHVFCEHCKKDKKKAEKSPCSVTR